MKLALGALCRDRAEMCAPLATSLHSLPFHSMPPVAHRLRLEISN